MNIILRYYARSLAVLLTLALVAGLALPRQAAAKEEAKTKVLVSTFPVYQLTRNVVAGSRQVQVELMIPAQLGCPHDYALTPQDMRKLAEAEVFIINGLGLEEFLGAPLQKANPKLQLIDSSKDIGGILAYADEDARAGEDGHHHENNHDAEHHGEHEHAGDAHIEAHHHAHDAGPNPHLFASPRMAALQVANIVRGLAAIIPAEKALYEQNALAYSAKLKALDGEFQQLGKKLANPRIVTQHGVFDYLARDMGLEIVAVIAAHPGQDPSAAEALELVRAIESKKAGAIFTEPQYPDSIAQTIAKESGIPLAVLDPVANGPQLNAPLDYYESIMRKNLQTLADTLGTK